MYRCYGVSLRAWCCCVVRRWQQSQKDRKNDIEESQEERPPTTSKPSARKHAERKSDMGLTSSKFYVPGTVHSTDRRKGLLDNKTSKQTNLKVQIVDLLSIPFQQLRY
jgi:hypothetical protein